MIYDFRQGLNTPHDCYIRGWEYRITCPTSGERIPYLFYYDDQTHQVGQWVCEGGTFKVDPVTKRVVAEWTTRQLRVEMVPVPPETMVQLQEVYKQFRPN